MLMLQLSSPWSAGEKARISPTDCSDLTLDGGERTMSGLQGALYETLCPVNQNSRWSFRVNPSSAQYVCAGCGSSRSRNAGPGSSVRSQDRIHAPEQNLGIRHSEPRPQS